ncbi:regulatory protein RecX [Sphingomonas sp. GCM10030256]|uniref:regulatory protein RecX n=1 Tax=Sphingomonas sp. GCM10030256 TaxID=3273427 RepID=UPI00360FCA38
MTRTQDERRGGRRARPPLGDEALRELALAYVSRFATTRARLRDYLRRKVRERGWGGDGPPDFDKLADRLAELGYVDDAAFALAKSRSLSARGYGARRVDQALRAAGVDEGDGEGARALALTEAAEAALRFARRRRLGPFAAAPTDPSGRQRALAAMVRAGHDFALARAVIDTPPGAEISVEQLLTY